MRNILKKTGVAALAVAGVGTAASPAEACFGGAPDLTQIASDLNAKVGQDRYGVRDTTNNSCWVEVYDKVNGAGVGFGTPEEIAAAEKETSASQMGGLTSQDAAQALADSITQQTGTKNIVLRTKGPDGKPLFWVVEQTERGGR